MRSILFYDGDCALCNHSVQFVVRHEKSPELYFSPLQSDFARKELAKHHYDFSQMATFALIKNGKIYYKSAAALNLARFLKAPYNWAFLFIVVPPVIRNAVYDFVSKRRKKWFKKKYCFVPNAEVRRRFVE